MTFGMHQPSLEVTARLSRRPRDMLCWRMAAIHRCCIRHGKTRDWALARVREICPDGHRDHMVDVWFMGIDRIRTFPEPDRSFLGMAA